MDTLCSISRIQVTLLESNLGPSPLRAQQVSTRRAGAVLKVLISQSRHILLLLR